MSQQTYNKDVRSSGSIGMEPICTIEAHTEREFPVLCRFGGRYTLCLTPHEAVALARALLDAAVSIRPDLRKTA